MLASVCACGSTSPKVTHPPLARETSERATTESVERDLASACFAEPVIYRRTSAELPERNLAARLRACDGARDVAACRFPIAREYFDGRRHERAAPLLLQIAHASNSALAAEAAELEIESVYALGSETNPPRSACYDLLATEVPKLLDEFCSPRVVMGGKKLCAILYAADVDMTRCSECTLGSASGRDPDFEQLTAARLFFETAIERCAFGRGAEITSQILNEMRQCDELLYRASELYEYGGSERRARQVQTFLLDPKNGLDQTKLALRLKEALRLRQRFERRE
jgi:hypothetical protein